MISFSLQFHIKGWKVGSFTIRKVLLKYTPNHRKPCSLLSRLIMKTFIKKLKKNSVKRNVCLLGLGFVWHETPILNGREEREQKQSLVPRIPTFAMRGSGLSLVLKVFNWNGLPQDLSRLLCEDCVGEPWGGWLLAHSHVHRPVPSAGLP